MRSPRVSIAWARDQVETYGRDNPWVKAYILGQFPPASINALISIEEVETAMRRHLDPDEYQWAQKRLGVDVARFGDDRSVIFPRQGLAAFKPIILRNERTTAIAARVAMATAKWGSEIALVDDSGHWGHGVIDNLMTAGIPAVGILFEDKALSPRYFNRRSEMLISAAEWVKRGGALPPVGDLPREMTAPTYTFVNGKFQVEAKDQIKARLGFSPDVFDALSLTFAIPDQPAAVSVGVGAQPPQHQKDWDPFARSTE
jgi:hypothetical protein